MTEPLITDQEFDDFLNVRIVRLAAKQQRLMLRNALRDAGLPVLEWRILFSVAHDRSAHLRAITRRGALDPAHASRAAASLERKNLIRRDDDPKDQRRRLLSLTPEGEAMFHRVWAIASRLNSGLLKAFSQDELDQMKQLLDRAHDAIDEMMRNPQSEEPAANAA